MLVFSDNILKIDYSHVRKYLDADKDLVILAV